MNCLFMKAFHEKGQHTSILPDGRLQPGDVHYAVLLTELSVNYNGKALSIWSRRTLRENLFFCTQRVNSKIRHMHREHSAHSNPRCALRASFMHTCDSWFYL